MAGKKQSEQLFSEFLYHVLVAKIINVMGNCFEGIFDHTNEYLQRPKAAIIPSWVQYNSLKHTFRPKKSDSRVKSIL